MTKVQNINTNIKTTDWSKINKLIYRPKMNRTGKWRPNCVFDTVWDIDSTSTLYTEPTAIALLRMKWLDVQSDLIIRFQNNIHFVSINNTLYFWSFRTSANLDRFSKFFHWQIPKETVTIAGSITSCELCCFTTLRNSKISKIMSEFLLIPSNLLILPQT